MADTGKIAALINSLAKVDTESVKQSVEDWLDDHPEATTTVQDGSITKAKLDNNLQSTVDDVSDLKSALSQKVTEPQTDGTDGQVLATNGQGGRYWKTVSEGGGQTDIGLSVVNGIICITYEEAV